MIILRQKELGVKTLLSGINTKTFSDHPVLAYGGGIIGGSMIGGSIGGAIGKRIKRKPREDEIQALKDRYEFNKKDLKYLESGKPINEKFLYPDRDDISDSFDIVTENSAWGNNWGPDGDDEKIDYKKLNNPKVRGEVIKSLKTRQREIEKELENTDKKTKTYEDRGKAVGSVLGAVGGGLGMYKFRKAIK